MILADNRPKRLADGHVCIQLRARSFLFKPSLP
jgi:hypothetical protein